VCLHVGDSGEHAVLADADQTVIGAIEIRDYEHGDREGKERTKTP